MPYLATVGASSASWNLGQTVAAGVIVDQLYAWYRSYARTRTDDAPPKPLISRSVNTPEVFAGMSSWNRGYFQSQPHRASAQLGHAEQTVGIKRRLP